MEESISAFLARNDNQCFNQYSILLYWYGRRVLDNGFSMDKVVRLIFLGWFLTQVFYLAWFSQTQYIFGKNDVDNYLFTIPAQTLTGINIRHIGVQIYQMIFPKWTFLFLIPAVYWFGIVLPVYHLFGKDGAFVYVFGTASLPLFFVTGLWSQYFSLSAFLLAWVCFKKGHSTYSIPYYAMGALLFLMSLTYVPILYFYVVMFLPIGYGIVFTGLVMLFFKEWMWWTTSYIHWNPAWVFLFYVCPIVWYKIMFSKDKWDEGSIGKLFILSLARLSRGLIFAFPWMWVTSSKREKIVIIAWWLFIMLLFAIMFWQELTCYTTIDGINCRQILTI
jgi:hypothetical protein